ncbi:MAG TPA: hypothetical protein VIS06_14190, partial [Mycobacteriales bacterium]
AVTADWQVSYNDLLLGSGTPYRVMWPIEGLADHPDVAVSDQPRLRSDGLTAGDDFLDGRSIVLRVEMTGSDDAAFAAAVSAFKRAFRSGSGVTEQPLTFQAPGVADGGVRRLVGRPRKLAAPVDRLWQQRIPVYMVQFDCTDPRIYDDVESTVSTDLADTGTGHAWPQMWPMDWGGASASGIVTATNAGTYSTPWSVTITGPVTNPSVENVDTGDALRFSANGGLTLADTDTLIIDSATRTALLNGTASRYDRLASPASWWDLNPGATRFRFGGTTTGTPTMALTWRSAWI